MIGRSSIAFLLLLSISFLVSEVSTKTSNSSVETTTTTVSPPKETTDPNASGKQGKGFGGSGGSKNILKEGKWDRSLIAASASFFGVAVVCAILAVCFYTKYRSKGTDDKKKMRR